MRFQVKIKLKLINQNKKLSQNLIKMPKIKKKLKRRNQIKLKEMIRKNYYWKKIKN